MLAHIARYEIDELVRATAASYTSPDLRSLDAIHLATAHAVFGGQLASFVSYDKRLLGAAQALRLPSPVPASSVSADTGADVGATVRTFLARRTGVAQAQSTMDSAALALAGGGPAPTTYIVGGGCTVT